MFSARSAQNLALDPPTVLPGQDELGTSARWVGHSERTPGVITAGIPLNDDVYLAAICLRRARFGSELPQLSETQRAGNIRQVIETQQDHFIMPLPRALPLAGIAADSVISKAAQRFRKVRIVGGDHATFAGGEMLHRMKAENGHVRTERPPVGRGIPRPARGGVLDHDQPTTFGDLQNRVQIRRMADSLRAEWLWFAA